MAQKPVTEYGFFHELTKLPYIEAVYVYDSYTAGNADSRSDLDIAILCPEATDEQWQAVRLLMEEATILLKMDVTRLDTLQPGPFKQRINKMKVPIYLQAQKIRRDVLEEKLLHAHACAGRLSQEMNKPLDKHTPELHPAFPVFTGGFDAFCRMARRALFEYGIRSHSPHSALREAFSEGWLKDRGTWEAMLEDYINTLRGITDAHARDLYLRLPAYQKAMMDGYHAIRQATKQLTFDKQIPDHA